MEKIVDFYKRKSNMNYEIITDSASNLTEDLLDSYRIHMISYISNVAGSDFMCFERGRDNEAAAKHFYNAMRDGVRVRTSLINMARFTEIFEPILQDGRDILFVGISGGLTATVQSARIAAEELLETYPDRKIICVDSMSASLGEGLLVIKLSRLRAAGATIEEAAAYYERTKSKMNHIFTVDNLKYLRRGGRISSAEAAIGNLLSIKPILKADDEGKIVVHDKVRGRRRALDYLIQMTKERIVHPERQMIGIAHCDASIETEYIANHFRRELGVQDIIIRYYDLCTGSHVGPGTIAIFFLGEDRMGPAPAQVSQAIS
ncbi:MAG: DegV family protein [Lachnospiraceae bacterium]|nr:DegV family protein [Lachnospiraceae bacterium]